MAPQQRRASIERTDEYDKFIQDLAAYHEKRGTHFDPEPKVGPRHLDLLRLYKRVTEEGGYDRASDIKGNKLAWRRISSEFLTGGQNVVQLAFLVKTAYYKNLAAYEISTFHKREPPPKEILEDVSAKGGDLLHRTLENYLVRSRSEIDGLGNGEESEEEQNTPKDNTEKMDVDEPGSTGGRVTRGLRHAPPQRVLFGAAADSANRQTRAPGNQNSPTPGSTAVVNGTYSSNGAAFTIANYEPRAMVPSAVKPVAAPANNPQYYRDKARQIMLQRQAAKGYQVKNRGPMMLPGTGFSGPNIYVRALLALQSGQPAEVRYALHHLVKISHERGDKYQFDQFPGLAEALLDQVLPVSSLFYNVKWKISYDDELSSERDVLNALHGTPDLLRKIRAHSLVPITDGLVTEEFSTTMSNINEAGLVFRNMVMKEENSHYAARIPLTRDFVAIALHLPRRATVVELQHYALEIAEQITKYYVLGPQDPLYISLVAQLGQDDRGAIITALRALSRISMNLEANNRLPDIPVSYLSRICDWLLVEDEELRSACLDFLYQFTAITENVEIMVEGLNMEVLVSQLVRVLMYGAHEEPKRERAKSAAKPSAGSANPPKLSESIIEELWQITDERHQSSAWLRTCFEEDPMGEITQLALWSAYNATFSNPKNHRPLMQAKDFITNVSTTFANAQAQVVANEEEPSRPKYTIRGVRPRAVPVNYKDNKPYMRCLWNMPAPTTNGYTNSVAPKGVECDMSVNKADEMWEHIVTTHLKIPKDPETGKFKVDVDVEMNGANNSTPSKTYSCHWGVCKNPATQKTNDIKALARHIQTHLPDSDTTLAVKHKIYNLTTPPTRHDTLSGKSFHNTAVDERNDAAGLPLASVLVLRNLARQMGKIDDKFVAEKGRTTKSRVGWVERCFGPVRERLFMVMAVNFSLREYLPALEGLIDRGMGVPVGAVGAGAEKMEH
ncbi:hypothetical protein EJ08DRAFT_635644 [Tothia fuscella]|uniref:ARID domain-containing protein n=1 Tax=Tothia fuscella TaxID=1048955 RepID=A0A9P4NNY2_9PEZI|nr:hypothetical protein EJ08DRAFT_635644 [Tothia fuscella]